MFSSQSSFIPFESMATIASTITSLITQSTQSGKSA